MAKLSTNDLSDSSVFALRKNFFNSPFNNLMINTPKTRATIALITVGPMLHRNSSNLSFKSIVIHPCAIFSKPKREFTSNTKYPPWFKTRLVSLIKVAKASFGM